MARRLERGSVTAISGGGCGHGMWVVRDKKKKRMLGRVRVVVLALGGNDFGEKVEDGPNGEKRPCRVVMGKKEVAEWMGAMVRWMIVELPGVQMRVMDFIPRESQEGKFAFGVRRLNDDVVCIEPGIHRHISTWQLFTAVSRSWRRKAGKGNRGSKEAKKEWREKGPPENIHRLELRKGLFGGDGVHLSFEGKKAFADILKWCMKEEPEKSKNLVVPYKEKKEGGEEEQKEHKLRAFFKF